MTLLAGGILLLWLIASIAAQLPGPVATFLRARDAAGLIPSWSFFAPNPVRTDCHLMYRHVFGPGHVSSWTEAFVWRAPRTRAIWNPDRRVEKAISDACSGLASRTDPAGVQWSTPYLLVLNYVSGLPSPAGATSVQFALLGAFGHRADRPPFVRFVSGVHPLERPPCPAPTGEAGLLARGGGGGPSLAR